MAGSEARQDLGDGFVILAPPPTQPTDSSGFAFSTKEYFRCEFRGDVCNPNLAGFFVEGKRYRVLIEEVPSEQSVF